MNKIDNSGTGIAALGRDGDKFMAHVTTGEMVVPPVINEETKQRIRKEMIAAGLNPNEYTVGGGMSINPITGMPEFGLEEMILILFQFFSFFPLLINSNNFNFLLGVFLSSPIFSSSSS